MQGGFHQTLSRELGVTPVRATLRTGKYGVYYPAKYTIKAAKWAAPKATKAITSVMKWAGEYSSVARLARDEIGPRVEFR